MIGNVKVSIIVPFYNTEKYISRCLGALLEQTYKNVEIICIDDGSTDSSLSIAQNFQKKDKRVIILQQENAGVVTARRNGIAQASGKYLMFCDSDDYYEPDMVAEMVTVMEQDSTIDLAICNTQLHGTNKRKQNLKKYLHHNRVGKYKFTQDIKHKANILLWNKIFRRKIWENYNIFGIGQRGDDENTVSKYFSVSSNLYYIEGKLYNHCLREDSLMGGNLENTAIFIQHFIESLNDVGDFFKKNRLWANSTDFFARRILQIVNRIKSNSFSKEEVAVFYKKLSEVSSKIPIQYIIDKDLRNKIFQLQKAGRGFNRIPEKNSVPIVFSCDDKYAQYLPVTLQSIIDNSSQQYTYHIIILDWEISWEATNVIEKQIASTQNFTLDIIPAENLLEQYKDVLKGFGRFSPAVYGRFLIPEICKDVNKAIYAEVDMIFNRDIAQLMSIDLQDNYIAAAIDISMEGNYAHPVRYANSFVRNYLAEDEKSHYIFSGFLLINIQEWRRNISFQKISDLIKEKLQASKWIDQDALNIICKNKIYYLDQSWNFCPFTEKRLSAPEVLDAIENDSFLKETAIQYIEASTRDDTVLHYAAPQKPWNSMGGKFDHYWWHYCRKTKNYEKLLSEASQPRLSLTNKEAPKPAFYKKYFKVFGIQVFKIKNREDRKKYYFLGIPFALKKLASTKSNYHFLGIPLIKRKSTLQKKKYYLLGLRILTTRYR